MTALPPAAAQNQIVPNGRVIVAFGVMFAALHLAQVQFLLFPSGVFKAVHLCGCIALVFLSLGEEAKRIARWAYVALAALAGAALIYTWLSYDALISERIFGPNNADIAVTLTLLALTLTATVRQWGWTLPLIAVGAIVYAYFGNYLPGDLFFHSGIGFRRLASYLAIPSFNGLLGSLTALSANMVFVFMIFAGLLKSSGGLRLVLALGTSLASRARSGPALIAIIGSGFMGMMSGSTVANVASTGAMTIPLMKRSGFSPSYAGAVESVASTGGQFTPPVMGLTAFLIVGITGISYNRIMLAAVAPALVYYAYLIFIVHIHALAKGIQPVSDPSEAGFETMSFREAVRRYGHLVFSISLLVYLLVQQTPPAIAALYAIAMMTVSEGVKQLAVSRGDPLRAARNLAAIVTKGFSEGALLGAQLAIIMATIGVLIDILVTTGFAQKLAFVMLNLAGGDLWLLLVMTAAACLIFGLGLPTPAAYVLVALLGAPALVDAGVKILNAHMFVFYFANMSAITPPVAVAALVASKIAGAPYFRTCFAALQLGLPGFILPFVFVIHPELLESNGDFIRQAFYTVSALAALIIIGSALAGYFIWRLAAWERAAFLAAGLALLLANLWSLAGAAILIAILLTRWMQNAGEKSLVKRIRRAHGKGD
jgi:TRAP transporter 4TM/12TM fusion protein